jgi:2'-5' RNA ligase
MPAGDVYDRLSGIIQRLSSRYGGPQFAPHVTLLGRCVGPVLELMRKTAAVAAGSRALRIRLEAIDFLDEYYRCLFVHAAPSEPLRKAHRAACHAFGHAREPAFMPHLSLLYGNSPQSFKKQAIEELGHRLDIQFTARSIHLYRTHGDPGQWRRMARFALK